MKPLCRLSAHIHPSNKGHPETRKETQSGKAMLASCWISGMPGIRAEVCVPPSLATEMMQFHENPGSIFPSTVTKESRAEPAVHMYPSCTCAEWPSPPYVQTPLALQCGGLWSTFKAPLKLFFETWSHTCAVPRPSGNQAQLTFYILILKIQRVLNTVHVDNTMAYHE